MAEIPVPFIEEDVDTSDRSGVIMTLVMLIAGFAVYTMTSSIGEYVANVANSKLGEFIGFNPATGEDSEVPGV